MSFFHIGTTFVPDYVGSVAPLVVDPDLGDGTYVAMRQQTQGETDWEWWSAGLSGFHLAIIHRHTLSARYRCEDVNNLRCGRHTVSATCLLTARMRCVAASSVNWLGDAVGSNFRAVADVQLSARVLVNNVVVGETSSSEANTFHVLNVNNVTNVVQETVENLDFSIDVPFDYPGRGPIEFVLDVMFVTNACGADCNARIRGLTGKRSRARLDIGEILIS